MIGTTVKLGFDGAAVQRGLASIGAAMKKMGSTIGRGMFERVGQRGTDALMSMINVLPDAIGQTGDFAGEINDLSKATGTAIPDLVRFFEMLRIGGAEALDVGKMMTTFSTNLHEAKTEGGAAADALAKLGFTMADFEGKSFGQQFEMVLRTMGQSGLEFEKLSSMIRDLFGARGTTKLLSMMREYDENAKLAGKTTADWGEYLAKNAGTIDTIGDAMGRWQQFKMSLTANLFDAVGRIGGGGGNAIDKLFDSLNPERLRPYFTSFFSWIGRQVEYILQNGGLWKTLGEGLKDAMKGIGEWIVQSLSALWDKIQLVAIDAGTKAGESFKAAIGMAGLPSSGDVWRGLRGAVGLSPTPQSAAGESTVKQLEEQIRILKDIRSQGNFTVLA